MKSYDHHKVRVALYLRVACPDQLQVSTDALLYRNMLAITEAHRNWVIVGTYVDHGSPESSGGTDALNRLLEGCTSGAFDLILTTSIVKLSKNTGHFIKLARELLSLTLPVGIWAENDRICTLSPDWENILVQRERRIRQCQNQQAQTSE